jgi:hypothetical protein|eukprot:TRINITY_DN66770_c0_g1_i1.p1 TRINITY_DN66770_c0_g1~~TRINITY_DN66770_c0_g1_i1.p1  ORF type:complete len:248 (-),score=33.71 TRINITY_DN66770_c0_g1_i1:11-754(-)
MRINLAEAVNPAANDPEGVKKAAIFLVLCIVCSVTGFLILPAIFIMLYMPGYVLAAMRNRATGDEDGKLPEPINPGHCWHGFIILLVAVVYSIPAMGVGFMALMSAAGAASGLASRSAATGVATGLAGMAGFGVLGLAALGLGLVITCFIPMVCLQYCKNYQFSDTLKFGEVLGGMMRSPVDYLVVVLSLIGINMLMSFIPVAGWLVGPPLSSLVLANLAGQYGEKVLDMHQNSVAGEREVGFNKFG